MTTVSYDIKSARMHETNIPNINCRLHLEPIGYMLDIIHTPKDNSLSLFVSKQYNSLLHEGFVKILPNYIVINDVVYNFHNVLWNGNISNNLMEIRRDDLMCNDNIIVPKLNYTNYNLNIGQLQEENQKLKEENQKLLLELNHMKKEINELNDMV